MERDPKTAKYLYFLFAISKNGNFRFCKFYDFPKMFFTWYILISHPLDHCNVFHKAHIPLIKIHCIWIVTVMTLFYWFNIYLWVRQVQRILKASYLKKKLNLSKIA